LFIGTTVKNGFLLRFLEIHMKGEKKGVIRGEKKGSHFPCFMGHPHPQTSAKKKDFLKNKREGSPPFEAKNSRKRGGRGVFSGPV